MAKDGTKPSAGPARVKAKRVAALEAKLERLRDAFAAASPAPAGGLGPLLAFEPGMSLADINPASTPGVRGGKPVGQAALALGVPRLSRLQERLYAEGQGGGERSLLLVVQGMDTSGKGGILRHVVGSMDPQGVRDVAFKAPTAQERDHDFLWRIRQHLPRPGEIGVFDRSHYEDVLVARVHDLVPRRVWGRRYATINRFEQGLVAKGTSLVKVMLHVSSQEQKKRLAQRLERPDKYWKYNPGDVDERARWQDYQTAYHYALSRCSTPQAPWYVVPADHKWYARWAVQQLLIEQLETIDPRWPAAQFDVEVERLRLAAT